MTTISFPIPLPLDDSGYLKRECPFCIKEFKIFVTEGERNMLSDLLQDNFMLGEEGSAVAMTSDEDQGVQATEYFCPYCGQKSIQNKENIL